MRQHIENPTSRSNPSRLWWDGRFTRCADAFIWSGVCVCPAALSIGYGCSAASDQLFSFRYVASGAISGNALDNSSHLDHNVWRMARERTMVKITRRATIFLYVIRAIAQLQCLIRLRHVIYVRGRKASIFTTEFLAQRRIVAVFVAFTGGKITFASSSRDSTHPLRLWTDLALLSIRRFPVHFTYYVNLLSRLWRTRASLRRSPASRPRFK